MTSPATTKLTYNGVNREISNGRIRSVYLLTGEEDSLAKEIENSIINAILPADQREFNLRIIYAGNDDQLADALYSLPVFAEKSVSVVRDAHQLKNKALDSLISYLENPPIDKCLILRAGKVDARKSFFKKVKQNIAQVDCTIPKGDGLINWIRDRAQQRNKEFDHQALSHLAAMNWPNLVELGNEIERLSLLVGDSRKISFHDIESMGGGSFALEWWKLADALGTFNFNTAIKTVENLLYWNVRKPPQLVNDIFRFYHQLWLIRWFMDRNKRQLIRNTVKLPEFVLKKYINYTSKIQNKELERCLIRIRDADLTIKLGKKPQETEIRLLMVELGVICNDGSDYQ